MDMPAPTWKSAEAIATSHFPSDLASRALLIGDIERYVQDLRQANPLQFPEFERLRQDRNCLLAACRTALAQFIAQRDGGRMLRRQTVIEILELAITPCPTLRKGE